MSHYTVTDQMGREASVPDKPQRIVSLVPSQTELLYDLGLDDRVVGITKFCIHPDEWHKSKTFIGGTKKFRFDAIEALQPDLIIGNKEENYREGIETLEQSYPVWMSDIFTLTDALNMIKEVGRITDTSPEALSLASEITSGFDDLPVPSGKSVAYLIWKNPYMAVGKNTFIDHMLARCGLHNVVSEERYVEITLEQLAEKKPDMVFLSSEPFPFKENNCAEIRNFLPASSVRLVDGEMFSWYGSRLKYAPRYFNGLLSG